MLQAKDELLAMLREWVWPMLEIDEEMDAALLAWAHFSQVQGPGGIAVDSCRCRDAHKDV